MTTYQNELDHVLDTYKEHGIKVCYRCACTTGSYELGHSRSHAHTGNEKKICLAKEPKSKVSLFAALHEIGHIVAYKADYDDGVPRSLAEWNATQWAIREMRENLHLSVPRKIVNSYKAYVREKVARGLRRGMKVENIPKELRNL